MSKEVAKLEESSAVTSAAITDVATSPANLQAIQRQLVEWCREKKEEATRRWETMRTAIAEAKKGGFKTRSMQTALGKLAESDEFYAKVLSVLEAGYMLFPPIEGRNIEVLAIRSESGLHGFERTLTWINNRAEGVQGADVLPAGEGSYVSPNVHWQRGEIEKTQGDRGTFEQQVWYPITKLNAPDFPLVMARSQCIEATNRAMVELVFDDIAIYPAKARKDPVILGRIFDPVRKRWLNFLISWRVDKRDL